ncbi:DUF4440 domain-containing protein [Amycolatopsis sp. WAC 01375]|uniref:SgcJ/EcaC family oxidoreductase n=1 Tax=unclassified Amycolatopsis TaxID=2618356 RepID=UPI000F789FE3|nr:MULTISPECIES: SgcJ/EcaC family oxidoreductase [unclassified Amycolatopsis]RSM62809.1 DUF4440 domain-containing protein [Amycolatopsis sp. WAC 01376]RSM78910.1 DUF4440 domain-containing protein [Amycolatopsis sp. WAC 01375]RSN32172.1 DUF4440 domain-containing protein [Amycolatopsis sp. WAC 01416]
MTTTETGTAADQAAIAALTQKVIAAWAYHDADSFAGVFTEDGTMILPGVYKKGRDEIRSFLVESFEGNYKGTQVTGRPLEIRFFTPDSGVLITQGGVLGPGETEVADSQSIRASWTVVKRDGGWQLASYQNTPAKQQLPKPGTAA